MGPKAAALNARITAAEPRLRAFVALDTAGLAALDTATGPLAGVSVGVKDVIDMAGHPTRNGSAACVDAAPALADATVVALLRAAGAAIVGKTATTEFAMTDPTETVNPFDPSRTPGGSSSGSGAAVGAGLLDIALGTQTAGSLCRPAAYCGAVGLKPGRGALPTAGLTPLAPSFDMPGIIARTVDLAEAAYTACTGIVAAAPRLSALRLGLGPVDPAAPVEPAARAALEAAGAALGRAGAAVEPVAHPFDLAPVVADHRCVMLAEAALHHGHRLRAGAPLRPNFRAALESGLATPPAAMAAARARLADATAAFWPAMDRFDALLTLVAPAPAPPIAGGTGYMAMLVPWTVLGGPLLCLPWGTDAHGLPLSVMLAGRPGSEALLLGIGLALAPMAPPLPAPVIG